MQLPETRFVRFVCWLLLVSCAATGGFFAGYRVGYLDGNARFESTYNGVRVRMVPIGEPAANAPR